MIDLLMDMVGGIVAGTQPANTQEQGEVGAQASIPHVWSFSG